MAFRRIKIIQFPGFLKIKVSILFLVCGLSLTLYAQDSEKLSIQFESSPLKKVFSELTTITGYEFAYSDTEINSAKLISVSVKEKNAEQIILAVAQKAGLEARFSGKKVILKPLVQQVYHRVSGVVTDILTGLTLPGASIALVSFSTGTITDTNGRFRIEVPASNAITCLWK
jgi:hypothetical protein